MANFRKKQLKPFQSLRCCVMHGTHAHFQQQINYHCTYVRNKTKPERIEGLLI